MDFDHRPLRWMLPILVALALLEALIVLRRDGRYDWKESAASLGVAVGQRIVGVLAGGATLGAMTMVWEHRLWTVPLDSVWGIALLFVSVEFFYYWHHRVSHESRWFWASHAPHHSPEHLNLSAAYRLGWTGAFTGAVLFYLPLAFLGFTPIAIFGALAINLLYQFWLHTELIPKLGWYEFIFNTPSHHRVHHASNPGYLDRNYGGVLIVFDRLFGTLAVERADTPCVYGLVKPVQSHNPFVIALHEWDRMARDLLAAKRWRDVPGYLFGRPGWRPENSHPEISLAKLAVSARSSLASPSSSFSSSTSRSSIMRHRSLITFAVLLGALTAGTATVAQTMDPQKMQQAEAKLTERFNAADANHDGKLTREEANGKMPLVYKNFDAIDTAHAGYVTMDQIKAFAGQQMAARRAQKGAKE